VLIAGNHNIEDIGNYTQRQIMLHYEATIRNNMRVRAALVVDVNKAFAGGSKADEHVKALLKNT
jgi:hypothetical protein